MPSAPVRGALHIPRERKKAMSNMQEGIGARVPCGSAAAQYRAEFEPATGTLWTRFQPRGTACFSLGLLNDMRAHDRRLMDGRGQVDAAGRRCDVAYHVTGSATPGV